MKTLLLITLISAACLINTKAAENITPSGLTIVVCDSNNKVLDTVIVPDDKESRSVKFVLPKGVDEIRVFAIGKRMHKDLPLDYYIKGRPDNEKWMGLGYVEAHVEKGVLVAIDGNGFGQFKIDEAVSKQIKDDIDAGKPAAITKMEKTSEQDAPSNP